MADDDFDDLEELDGNQGGGALRKKFEAALAENKELRQYVAKARAAELIAAKGYTHVKPEDLSSVKLDELEIFAEKLEQQKAGETRAVIERTLSAKGLSGEALTRAVDDLLNPEDASAQAALANLAAIGRASGAPAPDLGKRDTWGRTTLKDAFGAR